MSTTHSYAILEISQASYEEIKASLFKAGYQHAFHKDIDGREVIDMHGLAVATERVPTPKTIFVNGREMPFTEGHVTYEQIVALAYPDKKPWDGWSMTFHGKLPGGGEMNGCLSKGKSIRVLDRMVFSVANTSGA